MREKRVKDEGDAKTTNPVIKYPNLERNWFGWSKHCD